MRPDVGTVVADEDRQVADHANASLGAIRTLAAPLPEKCELQKTFAVELLRQFLARFLKSCGITLYKLGRPCIPALICILLAKRAEENVVFQPPTIFLAEALIGLPQFATRLLPEVVGCLAQ